MRPAADSPLKCLVVKRNGEVVCSAGIAHAFVINVMVGATGCDESPVDLYVGGMQVLPNGQKVHLRWTEDLNLAIGDVLTIGAQIVELPTPPSYAQATDSPEAIEEEEDYREFEDAHLFPQPASVPRNPLPELLLTHPRSGAVRVRLPSRHEHFLCTTTWTLWQRTAEQPARIAATSYSAELDATGSPALSNQLDWMSCDLALGETLTIEILA